MPAEIPPPGFSAFPGKLVPVLYPILLPTATGEGATVKTLEAFRESVDSYTEQKEIMKNKNSQES